MPIIRPPRIWKTPNVVVLSNPSQRSTNTFHSEELNTRLETNSLESRSDTGGTLIFEALRQVIPETSTSKTIYEQITELTRATHTETSEVQKEQMYELTEESHTETNTSDTGGEAAISVDRLYEKHLPDVMRTVSQDQRWEVLYPYVEKSLRAYYTGLPYLNHSQVEILLQKYRLALSEIAANIYFKQWKVDHPERPVEEILSDLPNPNPWTCLTETIQTRVAEYRALCIEVPTPLTNVATPDPPMNKGSPEEYREIRTPGTGIKLKIRTPVPPFEPSGVQGKGVSEHATERPPLPLLNQGGVVTTYQDLLPFSTVRTGWWGGLVCSTTRSLSAILPQPGVTSRVPIDWDDSLDPATEAENRRVLAKIEAQGLQRQVAEQKAAEAQKRARAKEEQEYVMELKREAAKLRLAQKRPKLQTPVDEEEEKYPDEPEVEERKLEAPPIQAILSNTLSGNSQYQWLADLYGARVYVTEQTYPSLHNMYVTLPLIPANSPIWKTRNIFLHPLPWKTKWQQISGMINGVYVLLEETTKVPPREFQLPSDPKLILVVSNHNSKHDYAEPLSLNLICEGTIDRVPRPIEAVLTELEARHRSPCIEARISPLHGEVPGLTLQNLEVHNATNPSINRQVPDDARSVGSRGSNESRISTGSQVSLKPSEEESITSWVADIYNIDHNDGNVTDVSVLYNSYKTHKAFGGMLFRRFTDCMKSLYRSLSKRTTNKERKTIRGYRGFVSKQ